MAEALDKQSDHQNITAEAAASEQDRGRHAETPTSIPAKGWKDILVRVAHGVAQKNLGIVAAGVAFYALLAIFPGLGALVSIYGLIAEPSQVQSLVDLTGNFMPGDANRLIKDELTTLIDQPSGNLSLAAISGIVLALWSAHSGITTLMTAMNIAYGETERRGYIRRNLLALGMTAGAIVFIILTLTMITLLPVVIDFLPFSGVVKSILSLVRWPILAALVMLVLAVMFRLGPSRARPKWRWVSVGSIVTTVLWVLGSAGFSWYVSHFGSYNKTYGSLGAVIVLLMWLYISAYLALIGAEINAEAEHQTLADTTTGPPEPLGKRNAAVADTVGAST